jgi:HprK-related kinase A
LCTGPFRFHIKTSIDLLARSLHLLYADFPLSDSMEYADFHVRMATPRFRRWYRPKVQFYSDEKSPFNPLPLNQAFAMLEWCLNWSISSNAHQYLIIHAACIELRGSAVVLAAPPGAGKSTLTAGLVCRGWRLLSDELTLIQPHDGLAIPLARPIALKNQSIELIKSYRADAVIGPVVSGTAKGAIAHLKPPKDSIDRMHEPAIPRWVVFPKFEPGARASLVSWKKANALLNLADNAFNYGHHGVAGFECLSALIDRADCYQFTYSSLDDAAFLFEKLAAAG